MPMELTTFAVCRRVNERRFLLRPDAMATRLFTWLLGMLLPLFDIQLHAVTVMSTHYHMVLSARDQRASDFFERFDALLAKAVNVLRRGRRGVVWEPGRLGLVELKTVDAVVFQIAYAIVNPVAAGAVWSPEDWPGLSVLVDELGRRVLEAERPGFYFRQALWDAVASVELTWPPCLLALGEDEARRLVAAEVSRQLAEARAEIRHRRARVLGPIAARNASPYKQAKSVETFGSRNPHFATGPGRRAERYAAAEELVRFRQDYREAYERYRDGELDVVFPYGTMRMRQRHHVRVAAPPT